ncbi:MAG: AMP-binding protein [Caldilineaceae bacterium]|nr:AMP-binding protein [Caldilineaceae bacterium]
MPTNLAALLHAQAAARPNHPALLDPTQAPITFAALQGAVNRGASLLRAAGLLPGDRVLVYQPISADLYVALGALFQAGLTAVFIDPGMDRVQLERAAALLAPRGFLATPRAHLLRLISPAIRRIPVHFTTGKWPLPGARRWGQKLHPEPEMADCGEETPALITVTSGSTGTPKFATRTHGFLRRQHEAIAASLMMPADTVVATTLPIFVLSFLASGLTTLLPNMDLRRPGRVQIAPLLAQMQEAGVNVIAASPAFLDQLARYCADRQLSLPQIRQVLSGGAPVFVDLMDQAAATMPNATLRAVYGATEAEPIATLDYRTISAADRHCMAKGAGLLVGKPVESLAVRVIPDRWGQAQGPYAPEAWAALSLQTGLQTGRGEIVVTGSHVLTHTGPGDDPALTKIRVGEQIWHRTGDAGYWDEQGRLWLLGRCSARIDRTHPDGLQESLYPFAVETAAHTFPSVKHAALVAQGNRLLLALELYTPQEADWLTELKQTLAWARLDELRILPHMPVDKRHNAKIDYPALRRMLGER